MTEIIRRTGLVVGIAALAVALLPYWALAQQPAAGAGTAAAPQAGATTPGQDGATARRGGGFSQPTPADWNDNDGWTQIFDGKTLTNWRCDPDIWKVVDGAIFAESTVEKPTGTTYCTWMGDEPADFDLKVEYKVVGGANSGVQYRSFPQPARSGFPRGGTGARGQGARDGAPAAESTPAPVTTALATVNPCQLQIPVKFPVQARGGAGARGMMPGAQGGQDARGGAAGASAQDSARGGAEANAQASPTESYDVGGYQADFDSNGSLAGQLYENGMATGAPSDATSRGIITYKGQVVHLSAGGVRETIGCADIANNLSGIMNVEGWNYLDIIARGPVLLHLLNGRLITATIDDDPIRQKTKGRIAVQIEGQGQVYFRNLYLKKY